MKAKAREIADSPLEWLNGTGDYSDIILSSRVRLARNLKGHSFPWRAGKEELESCAEKVGAIIRREDSLRSFGLFEVDALEPLAKGVLIEKHLISPTLAKGGPGRGAAVDSRGIVSIMINEEDHIRIQAILGGLRIHEAYRIARQKDELLEALDYAFDSRSGYLTSCPTNVGTGLRASVMIHLPALTHLGRLGKLAVGCGKVGLTVRGMFGEGSESPGALYQISNQVTLGQTEDELVEKVSGAALGMVRLEQAVRSKIFSERGPKLEDKVWRAWGLLGFSRVMEAREALELLSLVRMGSGMGILPPVRVSTMNALLMDIQKAHIQARSSEELSSEELGVKRSEILRKALAPVEDKS
jgi:protein arginine kinase